MKSTFYKYLLFIITLILINEITKQLLNFNKLLSFSLSEQLTTSQIEEYFKFQNKWKWISFIFIPIFVLLKTFFIGTILYIGAFFFTKNEIVFKNIWSIVISAEFIFLLVPIFKIIWFYFFQTNYTLDDLQYFYPVSAINITGYKELEPWLIYPLQTLNLFELAYIIYLGYQIGTITKTNADTGLKIVAFSYVPALLLWVTVIMFFTLNYS